MQRLNYQHLLYFWQVARQGTVAQAARRLHLAQSTLSGQINAFQQVLGERLFVKRGRRLELTEAGRVAYRYADEIFSLGREFVETLRGQIGGRPVRLVVGVLDALPKSMVERLLRPAFAVEKGIRVVCREDRSLEGFLADLAVYDVDLILSDSPARPGLPIKLFNHLLGESGTTFFAAGPIASRLRTGFPASLDGEPLLLPGRAAAVRGAVEQWLEERGIHPQVAVEVDDSALRDLLGEVGRGVFAAASVAEPELRRRYQVEVVGRAEEVRQRFYAITAERRIRNPAVRAITEGARREVFAAPGREPPDRHPPPPASRLRGRAAPP